MLPRIELPRSLCAAVLGGALVAGLAGCAGQGASPVSESTLPERRGYVGVAAATEEYREAAARLTLPSDSAWPDSPEPATGPHGWPVKYQVGAATADAQTYWFCSWARQLFRSSVPERSVLDELDSVRGKYLYTESYQDADRKWFNDVLTEADHGTLAPMGDFVRDSCG